MANNTDVTGSVVTAVPRSLTLTHQPVNILTSPLLHIREESKHNQPSYITKSRPMVSLPCSIISPNDNNHIFVIARTVLMFSCTVSNQRRFIQNSFCKFMLLFYNIIYLKCIY